MIPCLALRSFQAEHRPLQKGPSHRTLGALVKRTLTNGSEETWTLKCSSSTSRYTAFSCNHNHHISNVMIKKCKLNNTNLTSSASWRRPVGWLGGRANPDIWKINTICQSTESACMSNSTQRPWKLVRPYRAMILKRSLSLTLGREALENCIQRGMMKLQGKFNETTVTQKTICIVIEFLLNHTWTSLQQSKTLRNEIAHQSSNLQLATNVGPVCRWYAWYQ